MSNDGKYNGWTNHSTWALALWLGNEEAPYLYWRERAHKAQSAEALAGELERHIKVDAPCGTPTTGMYADVELAEVNWLEVAQNLMEP